MLLRKNAMQNSRYIYSKMQKNEWMNQPTNKCQMKIME